MSKQSNQIVVPDEVTAAIKAVQTSSEDCYLVVGFSDKVTLAVLAQGTGPVSEIVQYLDKADPRFIYLRRAFKVEMANSVKFVFVNWTPSSIAPIKKGLLSTQVGQITDLFKPAHTSLAWGDVSDAKEEDVMAAVGFASGVAVHVQESKSPTTEKQQWVPRVSQPGEKKQVVVSNTSGVTVSLEDEADLKAKVAAVRKEDDSTDWVILGYKDIKTLTVLGTGTGLDELGAALKGDIAQYAFFRARITIDGKSHQYRFGVVNLVPSKVKPTDKAKISTHKGFVSELLAPFHNEFLIQTPEDFNSEVAYKEIIRVAGASATKYVAE